MASWSIFLGMFEDFPIYSNGTKPGTTSVVVDAIKRAEGERVEAERIRNITGVVGTDYFRLIHDAHEKATKIWPLKGMDADHVTAWSKGGTTDELNCEMLCIPQNRSNGNC